jgi:hypothetical protein
MSAAPRELSRGRPTPPRGASSGGQFVALLLLAVGVQAWIVLGRAQLGERRQLLAGAVAVVLAILAWVMPGARAIVLAARNRVAQRSRRGKVTTAIVIALISSAYLYGTARFQHRDFSPILHDEYSYLIGAKTIAGGHLWLPRHELSDFFETFHVITDRVYASKYGPGTAMFYAPAVWLHVPMWWVPLVLSGAAVALIYLLGTELFDGVAGLLAALILLSLGIFRRTSIMIMPQAPMLFLVLLAMLAFIYWRRKRGSGWMVLLGICVGWGAITRPVDALCMALPLVVAVLLELRQSCNRGRVKSIGLGLMAVLPFLLLQAVYDKGVTGHVTTLPWNYYGQLYDPYDAIGRAPIEPAVRPKTTLPQKVKLFEKFTVPAHRELIGKSRMEAVVDRTSRTLAGPPLEEQEKKRLIYGALPSPLLIALLPVGLLGLVDRKRWVVWLALLPFLALYASYSFFFPHYAVAIVPAVVVNLLAAKAVLQGTWPAVAGPVGLVFTLGVAAAAVTALPELNSSRRDQWFDAPLLRTVDRDLAGIDRKPAIVLFKYDPERVVHEEPVYNIQTAWPDDATVIRANDLGAENARLFEYYAKKSPGRAVYRFDEGEEKLEYLGTVSELLKGAATGPAKR